MKRVHGAVLLLGVSAISFQWFQSARALNDLLNLLFDPVTLLSFANLWAIFVIFAIKPETKLFRKKVRYILNVGNVCEPKLLENQNIGGRPKRGTAYERYRRQSGYC